MLCTGNFAMTAPIHSIYMDNLSLSSEPDSRPLQTKQAQSLACNFRNLHVNPSSNDVPIIPITNKYRSDKKEYRFAQKDRLYYRIWVSTPFNAGIVCVNDALVGSRLICIPAGEVLLTVEKRE